MAVAFKIVFQATGRADDLRRLVVPAAQASTPFEYLISFIRSTYSIEQSASIIVKYKDEDDELITVSTNVELLDAVSSGVKGLRFIVTTNADVNSASAAAVATPKPATPITGPTAPPALSLPASTPSTPVVSAKVDTKHVAPAPVAAPAPAAASSPVAAANEADDDGFLHVGASGIVKAPTVTPVIAAPAAAPAADNKSDPAPAPAVKEPVAAPTPAPVAAVVVEAPAPVKAPEPKAAPAPVAPAPAVVTPIIAAPAPVVVTAVKEAVKETAPAPAPVAAAPAPSVVASLSVPKVVEHIGVSCDGCGQKPIRGIRYNCITCPNYDLCSECERDSSKHPATHAMLKIRNPIDYEALAASNGADAKKAAPSKQPAASVKRDDLKAEFVTDISIPDGSTVLAGSRLHKVWSVKNIGTAKWPADTTLQFVGGEVAPAPNQPADAVIVPLAEPNKTVSIGIDLLVPSDKLGRVTGYYRLVSAGQQFGSRMWVEVTIVEPKKAPTEPVTAAAPAPAKTAEPAKVAEPAKPAAVEAAPIPIKAAPSKPAPAPAPAAAPVISNFKYAKELAELQAMGFTDAELVAYLLTSNNGDVGRVVNWMLQNAH